VRRVLASARWRRRLAWTGCAAALTGAVTAVVVFTWTGSDDEPVTDEPGLALPDEPQPVRFDPDRRQAVLGVAARFVGTAVARRHVERSWSLVVPALRKGYTRRTWAGGNIPVVPYPVGEARWRFAYSYPDEVGLEVALFPRRKADVDAVVFDLGLRRLRVDGRPRWLVESFTPSEVATSPSRAPSGGFQGLPRIDREAGGTSAASATWLIVPFVLLGLAVAAAVGLGVGSWYRGRRAVRLYERQTSSTRPS
jgi:hypothetical protein